MAERLLFTFLFLSLFFSPYTLLNISLIFPWLPFFVLEYLLSLFGFFENLLSSVDFGFSLFGRFIEASLRDSLRDGLRGSSFPLGSDLISFPLLVVLVFSSVVLSRFLFPLLL
ncbi:MAG: hypothetical protein LBD11_01420 [Candidatus Peribacteria bacterium]|nr:hypothetical protein [Candidatus Peribacteria bacterium]